MLSSASDPEKVCLPHGCQCSCQFYVVKMPLRTSDHEEKPVHSGPPISKPQDIWILREPHNSLKISRPSNTLKFAAKPTVELFTFFCKSKPKSWLLYQNRLYQYLASTSSSLLLDLAIYISLDCFIRGKLPKLPSTPSEPSSKT